MEIIGRNIRVISSGLESIASGIQQNAQVQGPAAINDPFDSFLPEHIGISGALEFLPRVGDAGQVLDPLQYFQTNSGFGGPQNSNSFQTEFIEVLKDQNFNPATELQGLVKNNEKYLILAQKNTSMSPGGFSPARALTEYFDFLRLKATDLQGTARQTEAIAEASKFVGESLIRKEPEYLEGEPPPSAYDIAAEKQKEIEKKMEEMRRRQEFENFKKTPLQAAGEPVVDYSEHVNPKLQEYTPKDPEYIPPDSNYGPLSSSRLEDMINSGKIQGTAESLTAQKSETGSATQADQRGIIVVGGKEESVAQRGIIIVGGKTEGTYFETIDDTVLKMNNNPAPETVQLFEQQVGALQDMSSTVTQTVQMNQQIASSLLTSRVRV